MKRTISFILLVLLFCGLPAMAQQQAEVSVKTEYNLKVNILNKRGKPFRSAPVVVNVKGGKDIYHADKNGRVTIPSVKPGDLLDIHVGDNTFVVEVTGYDSLNMVFKNPRTMSKVYSDNEVYETGFGPVPRHLNTGAYSSVDMKDVGNYRNLFEYLDGRVAGLEVYGNSLRIRGSKSINGSNEPLVVVDGTVIDARTANQIVLPSDIQSVTVDKIGSLYGVRGANGVIIITTKRGGSEKR